MLPGSTPGGSPPAEVMSHTDAQMDPTGGDMYNGLFWAPQFDEPGRVEGFHYILGRA